MPDPGQFPFSILVGRAIRANWPISLTLGSIAAAIIVSYYFVAPLRTPMEQLAELKERYGLRFAIVSTGIFGGLLPLLIEQFRSNPSRRLDRASLLFFTGFWGFKGAEIDLLYRGQALLFGDVASPGTVVAKVTVDMLIYVPLWAIPSVVIAYLWLDNSFDYRRTLGSLGPKWYRHRILPVMVMNWIIWVPAVTVIYSLPLTLQLPVQNIILLLFAIVLLFMTAPGPQESAGLRRQTS